MSTDKIDSNNSGGSVQTAEATEVGQVIKTSGLVAVSQKAAPDQQSVVSSVVKEAIAGVTMVEAEGKNGNRQSVVGGEVSQEDPIVEELGHPVISDVIEPGGPVNNYQRSIPADGLYRARIVNITNLLERPFDGDVLLEVEFELQVGDELICMSELYSSLHRHLTSWQSDLCSLLSCRPDQSWRDFGPELDFEVFHDTYRYVLIRNQRIVSVHSEVEIESRDNSVKQETTLRPAREIAEAVLGQIDWIDDHEGYCECPGKTRHTKNDGSRDCIVYLDRIPTIHCVHTSCESVVNEKNRVLRDAVLSGNDVAARRLTDAEKAKQSDRQARQLVRERAAKALPQVLIHHWTYDQICKDSPVALPEDPKTHWHLLLSHFPPDDVVWIGGPFDSGKPEHQKNFKPASDWLKETQPPGPLVCPVAFKNTSMKRSNENVMARRFLVVESDVLSKDEVGAVFQWLRRCGLELVAIVDTAGKSLHAWFTCPAEDQIEDLRIILPAYKCDPGLFTASQPVRLPGVLRDDKYQRLVYLKKGGAL